MSLDLNILRALSTRNRFLALKDVVPGEMVDPATHRMLGWYNLYFSTHPDHVLLDPSALMTLIRLRGNLDDSNLTIMQRIVEQLQQPIDDNTLQATVQALEDLSLSGDVGRLVSRFNSGDEVDIAHELRMVVNSNIQRRERTTYAKWADDDPLTYIEAAADDSGLQLGVFQQFSENLKGLNPGHNIGIAAPTDAGKTSLICTLAVCLAKQARTVYPDQPLLYLLNEGTAEGVTPRMYQTALQVQTAELLRIARQGTLVEQYVQQVGRRDAIRLVNIHGLKLSAVARIIEAHNPYAVFTDMTGRIGANSNTSGGANDVSQLEEVWNHLRELAAIQKFIHFGTVQVSAEGFDQLYPPLSAVQNSKTGIQTTWDLAIMMGRCTSVSNLEDVRGISTPKNKLARSGKKSGNQFQVLFDPSRNHWDGGINITGV